MGRGESILLRGTFNNIPSMLLVLDGKSQVPPQLLMTVNTDPWGQYLNVLISHV